VGRRARRPRRPVRRRLLLITLWQAGAGEQAIALAARAAAHVALDDPDAVAGLLGALREVGAGEQAAVLLARDPAGHAAVDHLVAIGGLLGALRRVGAGEQVTTLAARAAGHVALDNPRDVAVLLYVLQQAVPPRPFAHDSQA
jgi:hypothetical protein